MTDEGNVYPVPPTLARLFPRLLRRWVDGAELYRTRFYVVRWRVVDGRLTTEYEETALGAFRIACFGPGYDPPFC